MTAALNWLEQHSGLATWLQTIGVIVGIVIALIQLRHATSLLKVGAETNRLALENSVSELLVGIQEAVLNHPDSGDGFPKHQRIHLMRIHYLYRTHHLHRANLIDGEQLKADGEYVRWAASLPDFGKVWRVFRDQYPASFAKWVESLAPDLVKMPQPIGGETAAQSPTS